MNEWATSADPKDVFLKYDLDGDYFLDFKEFSFLNIFENIKYGPLSKCKNCLTKIKSEIYEFFDYLDCDKDGFISSEDMNKAFENLKTDFKVLATMINDFTLKTMELKSATLDIKDFSFG